MSGLSVAWLSLLVDLAVKTTLLWAVAWVALKLLRIRDSNVQHRVWSGVLAGMLCLPLLVTLLPSVPLPLPIDSIWWTSTESLGQDNGSRHSSHDGPPTIAVAGSEVDAGAPLRTSAPTWGSERTPGQTPTMAAVASGSGAASDPVGENESVDLRAAATVASAHEAIGTDVSSGPGASYTRNILFGIMVAWAAIAALLLVQLAVGIVFVSRLTAKSQVIDWEALKKCTDHLPERLTLLRATVRESSQVVVPVSIGCLRPRVLLPVEWRQWSAEKLQAVLIHELTHVSRRDYAVAFLASLNRSLHWYHPLAWWLHRHLTELAEEACDDAAIAHTGNPTRYATHLLEVAASLSQRSGRVVCPCMPMAQQSDVETRISAILDFTRPLSQNLTWKAAALIALVCVPAIGLAAVLRPARVTNDEAQTAVAEARTEADGHRSRGDQLPNPGAAQNQGPDPTEPDIEPRPAVPVGTTLASQRSASVAGRQAETSAVGGDTAEVVVVAGTVVDPQAQPVAGAKVRVLRTKSAARYRSPRSSQVLAECTTDDQGRFTTQLASSAVPAIDTDPNRFTTDWIDLIAMKPGFGFAYGRSQGIDPSDDGPNRLTWTEHRERPNRSVLTLVADDAPIHGRLVDINGNAIVNAEIAVRDVWTGEDGTLDAWRASANAPDEEFGLAVNRFEVARDALQLALNHDTSGSVRPIFQPAKTAADGRFSIRGVGRQRLAELIIRASGHETVPVYVRTERGDAVVIRGSRGRAEQDEPVYAAEFSRVLGPSVPVVGRVTDRETGAGVAGCLLQPYVLPNYYANERLRMEILKAETDEAGDFRLEGLPLGRSGITIRSPRGSAYFSGRFRVNLKPEIESATANAQLVEGILVSGRVTDEETGAPVLGTVEYFAYADNPSLARTGPLETGEFRTDTDGGFSIPVLPGQGILAFKADDWNRYLVGTGREKIDATRSSSGGSSIIAFETSPRPCFAQNFNTLVAINPKPGSQADTINFSVSPGVTVRGKAVDSSGRSVSNYYVNGQLVEGEQFIVSRYAPSEGRRLTFFKPQANLVGLLDLNGPQPDPVEAALIPGGTIFGRIVDADGIPVENLEFQNSQVVFGNEAYGQLLTHVDKKPVRTDREGRFRFEGIVPGLKYAADVFAKGKLPEFPAPVMMRIGNAFSDVSVESGEVRDLGEIVVNESTN